MATIGGGAATFDLEALRRGVESRNLDTMLGLYDDNAEITLVDQRHTPSHPAVLRGRGQISAFLSELLGREMTHKLDHVVVGDGTISFVERCTYPDGSRVTASSVLDVADGRIIKQEEVQAWDPGAPVPQFKDFASPDEVRVLEKGRLEVVHMPSGDVARLTQEPGWRWSEHVKPIAGTDLCQQTHTGYQITGRMRVQMADGTTFDVLPGQATFVPPGHDAWVIGDEPAVTIDWAWTSEYVR